MIETSQKMKKVKEVCSSGVPMEEIDFKDFYDFDPFCLVKRQLTKSQKRQNSLQHVIKMESHGPHRMSKA